MVIPKRQSTIVFPARCADEQKESGRQDWKLSQVNPIWHCQNLQQCGLDCIIRTEENLARRRGGAEEEEKIALRPSAQADLLPRISQYFAVIYVKLNRAAELRPDMQLTR